MIRPLLPTDTPALLALLASVGLFSPDELVDMGAMLADYSGPDADAFWLVDDDNELVGVTYCEPERLTAGTWNLQLIAVHPDRQGQGRGTSLLRHIEHTLSTRGARLLLVETSGLATFGRTRTFYDKCGFSEEARIRDFYKAGEDKIVFRKLLPL